MLLRRRNRKLVPETIKSRVACHSVVRKCRAVKLRCSVKRVSYNTTDLTSHPLRSCLLLSRHKDSATPARSFTRLLSATQRSGPSRLCTYRGPGAMKLSGSGETNSGSPRQTTAQGHRVSPTHAFNARRLISGTRRVTTP